MAGSSVYTYDQDGIRIPDDQVKQYKEEKARANYAPWLRENLSEKNPLPWQQYFSEGIVGSEDGSTRGLIGDQIDRAYSSQFEGGLENPDGYFQKTLSRNQDPNAGNLQNSPLGGYSSPMSEALAQKYSGQAKDLIKGGRDKAKGDMTSILSKDLGRIGNELGSVEKLRMQNFKEQYAYQQQRQQIYDAWKSANNQAQAQFWGQALGLGGTVIAAA